MTTPAPATSTQAPSLPVTIHLDGGVVDQIREWQEQAHRLNPDVRADAKDYQDLAHQWREAFVSLNTLLVSLTQIMRTSNHDGPTVNVYLDEVGLFWRYDKSGYHGGIVRHESDGKPTFQVHT